jgi:hypothetical protein
MMISMTGAFGIAGGRAPFFIQRYVRLPEENSNKKVMSSDEQGMRGIFLVFISGRRPARLVPSVYAPCS